MALAMRVGAVTGSGRCDGEVREAILAWDGEQVVYSHDAASGAWLFIALHSTVLGPAAGGTRLRVYPAPTDGLRDAMALAAAMTRKCAVAGLPLGGGKAVMAVPSIPAGAARRPLLECFAHLVNTLDGRFVTGPDMNTTVLDMDLLREHTDHVFGTSAGQIAGRSVADSTALGTLHGIRAALARRTGTSALTGRTVLVQGTGAVGSRLAELLTDAGARVLVSDVARRRARDTARHLGATVVEPADVLTTRCDVLAPCATGGVLGAGDVHRLGAPVVAGCANNQLRTPGTGDALHAAGIRYAPDYVIGSGGALHAVGVENLGWTLAHLDARLRGIGDALTRVLTISEVNDISTVRAADRLVAERLPSPAVTRPR